eukprot:scaffold306301_cov26-Tisochrysis_lutea.AAC.1
MLSFWVLRTGATCARLLWTARQAVPTCARCHMGQEGNCACVRAVWNKSRRAIHSKTEYETWLYTPCVVKSSHSDFAALPLPKVSDHLCV